VYLRCRRLILVLIVAFWIPLLSGEEQHLQTQVGSTIRPRNQPILADYAEHPPIVIGEEGFGTHGWPGNGTIDEPYIIYGLNITHNGVCISISDTTDWFVIDSCLLLSNQTGTGIGVSLSNVMNGLICNSTIGLLSSGIYTTDSQNVEIHNCTISDSSSYGIDFRQGALPAEAQNLTIKASTIEDCQTAVNTDYCQCEIAWNTINNGHHGLWLNHPTQCQIQRNNLTGMSGIGMLLTVPTYTTINDNQLTSIGSDAINIDEDSMHVNVTHNTIHSCSGDAVLTDAMKFSWISFNDIRDAGGTGVYVTGYKPRNVTVAWNAIRNTDGRGIWAYQVNNFTMEYNRVFDTHGVHVSGVDNNQDSMIIESNVIANSENTGFGLANARDTRFYNNTIAGGGNDGLSIDNVDFSVIMNNSVYENVVWGIYVDVSDSLNITGNRVYSNDYRGIYVHYEGGNHRFYANQLGWNTPLNAIDETSSDWDDGVSVGNKWSDYNGTGVYSPEGSYLTDHYPEILSDKEAPVLSQPDDAVYEVGETGNAIQWLLYDEFPSLWMVQVNGSTLIEQVWVDGGLSVDIDGFEPGWHNITLVARDGAGNNETDQVWLHVTDSTPPIIDSPADADYELGTSHFNITWNATDDYPMRYVLLSNGSSFADAAWNGSDIEIDVGGLGIGKHNLTMKVFDKGWNVVTDSLWLEVHDTVSPLVEGMGSYEYEGGSLGHLITWNVSDYAPNSYVVFRNGTEVKSGNWSTGQIVVSVDGLNPYLYNYTIVLDDTSGNPNSDTVTVIVTDTLTPAIDSPSDTSVEA
jgi:parallel beta-helix repeat protein